MPNPSPPNPPQDNQNISPPNNPPVAKDIENNRSPNLIGDQSFRQDHSNARAIPNICSPSQPNPFEILANQLGTFIEGQRNENRHVQASLQRIIADQARLQHLSFREMPIPNTNVPPPSVRAPAPVQFMNRQESNVRLTPQPGNSKNFYVPPHRQNAEIFPGPMETHGRAPQGNNLRSHHLKSSDFSVPKYCGASDKKTPYDFILELDKYQSILGYSEVEMLQLVVLMSLTDEAYTWYRYETQAFANFSDFKNRIRTEFQPIGYQDELRRELERRTQGYNEPLTAYIRVIMDYYERLGDPTVSEAMKVDRIKKQMHPEYRAALPSPSIHTLRELKDAAIEAQEFIKTNWTHKSPPIYCSAEPSLAWKPLVNIKEPQSRESSLVVQEETLPKYIFRRLILTLITTTGQTTNERKSVSESP